MKKLNLKTFVILIIISLFPYKTWGAVNDVYYCEMDQFGSTEKGKMINYKLEKFKFKRYKNEIVFGNEENTFKNYSMKVLYSSGEWFSGGNQYVRFSHRDNYFHFSRADPDGAQYMSAKCSMF